MSVPIVFVDANVLYSKTLRDWLFLLRIETGAGMFTVHTSEDSLTELLYRKRRQSPREGGEFTARLNRAIRESVDDVVDSFDGNVEFPGLDIHDSHIHAAALACSADYLLTDDAGFGDIDPGLLPYEVHTSDSFFTMISEYAPDAVRSVALRQIAYYQTKAGSKKLDQALRDANCPKFAGRVERHVRALALGEEPGRVREPLEGGRRG